MSTVPSATPRRTRRTRKDLHNLPRWPALSHLYRAAEAVAPANRPPESFFSPRAWLRWLRTYLAYAFRPRHHFPHHAAANGNAIYELSGDGDGVVRVALAGDWGTGTDEAAMVAEQMLKFKPHFTLHIGDVYYVGDPPEVNETCLGIRNPDNNYDPTTWPIGSKGSFAMNGNHEMYANGIGYFDLLLPRLGLRGDGPCGMSGQQTSFFCLQNEFWRIVAVDTGYNSIGVPILSQIPGINSIPFVGGDCRLPQPVMQWLTDIVRPQQDTRGLVLMSHHQYYSGFDTRYRRPAQQLWQAGVRRPVIWFWGHEHRLAGYHMFGHDDLKAFGRCVGHGGMPLELGKPSKRPAPSFYDDRKGNGFGINGHVNLTFAGPNLLANYIDMYGTDIFQEKWSVDSAGVITLVSQEKLIKDADFHA